MGQLQMWADYVLHRLVNRFGIRQAGLKTVNMFEQVVVDVLP